MSLASSACNFFPHFTGVPGSAAKNGEILEENETQNGVRYFSVRWGFKEWTKEQALLNQIKIQEHLMNKCAKYVYQLEEGTDKDEKTGHGYFHFQGYIYTKQKFKARLMAMSFNPVLPGIHIAPSSNEGKAALKNYCMKDDTRVAGPWADDPEKLKSNMKKLTRKPYMGEDLVKKLFEWQANLRDYCLGEVDPRSILVYVDEKGHGGKSSFSKYMDYHHGAVTVSYGDSKDILYAVAEAVDEGNDRIFIFDLTRSKPKLYSTDDIWVSMEQIKNGNVFSTKYKSRRVRFNPPHVIIFVNQWPDTTKLTSDRFDIFTIPENQRPAPKAKDLSRLCKLGNYHNISTGTMHPYQKPEESQPIPQQAPAPNLGDQTEINRLDNVINRSKQGIVP